MGSANPIRNLLSGITDLSFLGPEKFASAIALGLIRDSSLRTQAVEKIAPIAMDVGNVMLGGVEGQAERAVKAAQTLGIRELMDINKIKAGLGISNPDLLGNI